MIVAELVAELRADASNWTGQLQAAQKQVQNVQSASQGLSKDAERLGGTLQTTEKHTTALGKSVQGVNKDMQGASQGFDRMSKAGQQFGQDMRGKVLSTISAFRGEIGAAVGVFAIWQSVMVAARVEEMNVALHQMGENAGYSSKQIDKQIAGIKEMGITTSVAQYTLSQFLKTNLDVAKATQLARVAQDTAIVSGQDSSTTLQWLIYGIQTYQTEIFRTQGLNINVGKSFQDYAKKIGVATESLTENQRQTAVMNEVLKQAANLHGLYEKAMGTASKQMRSFPRYVQEIQESIGNMFLPALTDAVFALKEVTEGFRDAISEGGALHPILKLIGDIGSATFKVLGSTVTAVTGFLGEHKAILTAIVAIVAGKMVMGFGQWVYQLNMVKNTVGFMTSFVGSMRNGAAAVDAVTVGLVNSGRAAKGAEVATKGLASAFAGGAWLGAAALALGGLAMLWSWTQDRAAEHAAKIKEIAGHMLDPLENRIVFINAQYKQLVATNPTTGNQLRNLADQKATEEEINRLQAHRNDMIKERAALIKKLNLPETTGLDNTQLKGLEPNKISASVQKLMDLNDAIEGNAKAIELAGGKADNYAKQTEKADKAAKTLAKTANKEYGPAMKWSAEQVKFLADVMGINLSKASKQQLESMYMAMGPMAEMSLQTYQLSQAYSVLNDRTKTVAEQQQALGQVFDAIISKTFDFPEAIQKMSTALDKFGEDYAAAKEKGSDISFLKSMEESFATVAQSIQPGQMTAGIMAMESLKQRLVDAGTAAGVPAEMLQQMKDDLTKMEITKVISLDLKTGSQEDLDRLKFIRDNIEIIKKDPDLRKQVIAEVQGKQGVDDILTTLTAVEKKKVPKKTIEVDSKVQDQVDAAMKYLEENFHGKTVKLGVDVVIGGPDKYLLTIGKAAHGLVAMAGGGVTKGPVLALIGEAGKEAVLPLTRHQDMVKTIRNTGMARDVLKAAFQATGGARFAVGGVISPNQAFANATANQGMVNWWQGIGLGGSSSGKNTILDAMAQTGDFWAGLGQAMGEFKNMAVTLRNVQQVAGAAAAQQLANSGLIGDAFNDAAQQIMASGQALQQFKQGLSDAATQYTSVTQGPNSIAALASGASVAKYASYAQGISQLQSMGLNQHVLDQLIQAGPAGLTTVQRILGGGSPLIDQLNKNETALEAIATALGQRLSGENPNADLTAGGIVQNFTFNGVPNGESATDEFAWAMKTMAF